MLQEENGITKSVFIELLGNALYAGHNLKIIVSSETYMKEDW